MSLLLLPLLWSCEPDRYPTEIVEDEVALRLHQPGHDSKSAYGDGVDQLFTGAELFVYNSTTGALEIQRHIKPEDLNTTITIKLLRGYQYDFYLLGNLYKIRKSDGQKMSVDVPYNKSELEEFEYRFDGSDIDAEYRYESLEEISAHGIPLYWKQLSVDPFTAGVVNISMKRLFSKLRLTIDHRGLSGSSLSDFVNGKVFIKQVNILMTPFSGAGSRARSSADVLPQGDYELSMDNDNGREYIFYVPENMQGELLPSNIDPQLKNPDMIKAAHNENLASCLTFLEFQGSLNGDAGITGDATYRFYLGENTTSNFNIQGNIDRLVALSFDPNSIYKATWKVNYDDVQDKRQFYMSGNVAGRLPDGKEIVVRPSRPGYFNLNIELPGGVNKITDASLVDKGFVPTSLTDYAWTSNCFSFTHDSANEPKRYELESIGVSCSYSSGTMTFSVTNPAAFVAGKSIPIEITFYPGAYKLNAVIVTREDIAVEEINGLSTKEGFYVGQKRSLAIRNFNGDKIYYSAEQSPSGRNDDIQSYNRQWKTSNEMSAAFPCKAVDADDYESQSLASGELLDIYAFYPNTAQNLYNFVPGQGKVYISSDDVHNDDVIEVPISISTPYYAGATAESDLETIVLSVDGLPHPLGNWFYTHQDGEVLHKSLFDPQLYKDLLYPRISYGVGCSPWIKHCVEINDLNPSIYLARTTLDGVKIEDVEFEELPSYSILFETNPATGLLARQESKIICTIKQPILPKSVSEHQVMYFDEYKITDSVFGFGFSHGFYEGDMSKIKVKMTGPSNDYICSDGTVVKPVIDFKCQNTLLFWEYRESRQVTVTASGEKVPGAVVVPYGPQRLSMIITNIHDGRELEYYCDFVLKYNITLAPIPVYPSSGDASVYMMSTKNFKYLKQLAPSMTKEQRRWMIKTLGTDAWASQIASTDDFRCIINGSSTYPAGRGTNYSRLPRTGYKAKYVDPSATVWTESLAEKVLSDYNYYTIHEPFFFAEEENGNFISEDASITGNPYLKLSVASIEKQGYIFMDDF